MTIFAVHYNPMVSIFDDMSQVTEDKVNAMLPLVNDQRRSEALGYKHLFGQFSCLKSWLMLEELLRPMGIRDLEMTYNEHGKPFLMHYPEIHFNLSHCKNGIAVVTSLTPVGIDIESFRKSSLSLINKTMNPTEAEWIMASHDPIEAFTQYWTKKEAVVKLRGTGIVNNLHHVLDGNGYRLETHVNREQRYAWTVAYTK